MGHGASSTKSRTERERGGEKEINEHSAGKKRKGEGKEGTSKVETRMGRKGFICRRASNPNSGRGKEEPSKVPFQKDV